MTDSIQLTIEEAHRRLGTLYGDRLVRVVLYGPEAKPGPIATWTCSS